MPDSSSRFQEPSIATDWRVHSAVIFILPFLIYAWSFGYGLTQLDDSAYYENPALQNGSAVGFLKIWTTTVLGDYSPVTQFTYWLDTALFGTATFIGARIHSLLWFGVGSIGIYALMLRLTGQRNWAFVIALLYAVHPICSVSVLWLAERKNLVSIAFAMWAIERYMAATASPSRRPILMGLAAGILFILALLAKPHALAVAPMLAVYELLLGRRPLRNAFLRLAPFVIISAAYFLISMKLRIDLARPFLGGSRMASAVSDGPILLQYVLHTVLPCKLALYYYAADLPVMSPQGWGCWFGVALIAAATLAISRRRKLVGAGWLLALAGLFPAVNLVPQLTPAADHYLQWALPGFLLVLILTVLEILERMPPIFHSGRVAAGLVLTAVASFGLLATLRNVEFRSKESLFATNVANQPDSALGWAGYAQCLAARHDPSAGLASIRALECPDQYRILNVYRYSLAKEAVTTLKANNEFERAEKILAMLSREINERFVRLIRAESAVRVGHAAEALQLLDPPNAGMLAAIRELRAQCRSGQRLPDALPKLYLEPDATPGDRQLDSAISDLLVSPLLTRAFAYWTLAQTGPPEESSANLEKAFDFAALAVNLVPNRSGQRLLLAMIYRRLGLPDAAEALAAK